MASKLSQRCYNILLLGAPGVGKGTYGKLLANSINARIMESGALCRTAAQTDRHIYDLVTNGDLLGDDEIFLMVENYLHSNHFSDDKRSVLFDGFPRTLKQTQRFHASELGKEYPLNLAIHFNLPHSVLKAKMLGRRVCGNAQCAANYNVCDIEEGDIVMPSMRPRKKQGFCDQCDSKLVQRDDDNERVIERRLNAFYALNDPMLEFYDKLGILMNYDIKKGVDDFPDILSKIEEKLIKDNVC
mmetsp:Transcript_15576/g.24597  ORF Transcript_15576/g.24597 Transcript_15576/m.24597 type:complete len:243 (-) Transcript_15576:594-1322(-)